MTTKTRKRYAAVADHRHSIVVHGMTGRGFGTVTEIRTAEQLWWKRRGGSRAEIIVELDPELDADVEVGERQRLDGRRIFRRWSEATA